MILVYGIVYLFQAPHLGDATAVQYNMYLYIYSSTKIIVQDRMAGGAQRGALREGAVRKKSRKPRLLFAVVFILHPYSGTRCADVPSLKRPSLLPQETLHVIAPANRHGALEGRHFAAAHQLGAHG